MTIFQWRWVFFSLYFLDILKYLWIKLGIFFKIIWAGGVGGTGESRLPDVKNFLS